MANALLNAAAGPDSPGWRTAVMVLNTDYSAAPPRFVEIGTAGSYTWIDGTGAATTFTFAAGTKWFRPVQFTAMAGSVLGYW